MSAQAATPSHTGLASRFLGFLKTNVRSKRSWIIFLAGFLVLYDFYIIGWYPISPYWDRGMFMMVCSVLIFLMRMPKGKIRRIILGILLAMSLVGPIWVIANEDRLTANFFRGEQIDFIVFLIFIIGMGAISTRTSGGMVMASMALLTTLYLLFGQYIPGTYGHEVFPTKWVATMLFTDLGQGAFGNFAEIGVSTVSIFLIFSSILLTSGLGDLFMSGAQGIFGNQTGGPAKIAVTTSALFGMLSGSPVANVAATGSFTIPLMKKIGYRPTTAASIEALASTGGALMPPIMGIGAFLMAEIVGVPYLQICVVALVPAFLWYYTLFPYVHYTALRDRVMKWRPSREEYMPVIKGTWHLSLSIIILVAALVFLSSAEIACFYSVVALIILTFFQKRTRLSRAKIASFLEMYAHGFVPLFVLVVCLGVFTGGLMGSGVHMKIGNALVGGIEQWWLALLVVFILGTVLGMVVPIAATYLAVAAVAAPALSIAFGYDTLQIHMFIFYISCLAPLTPPVAWAVFVAASIAGTPALKTGLETTFRGIALWIIPFAVFQKSLFFAVGTPLPALLLGIAIMLVGILVFVLGVSGFFFRLLSRMERIIAVGIGLLAVQPFTNEIVQYTAAVLSAALLVYWFVEKKIASSREEKSAQAPQNV